jgi:hypothetical protein
VFRVLVIYFGRYEHFHPIIERNVTIVFVFITQVVAVRVMFIFYPNSIDENVVVLYVVDQFLFRPSLVLIYSYFIYWIDY